MLDSARLFELFLSEAKETSKEELIRTREDCKRIYGFNKARHTRYNALRIIAKQKLMSRNRILDECINIAASLHILENSKNNPYQKLQNYLNWMVEASI